MQEELLHFIWKFKKIPINNVLTTFKEEVHIVKVGRHNQEQGPDFFNAQVEIGGQLWVGNVELHIKASDWYAHGHEVDVNYNNVILHVVWEDDATVFRSDNTAIPTLELKQYISNDLLLRYDTLFKNQKVSFINCETAAVNVDPFLKQNWIERLYFERLEQKSASIAVLLHQTKSNWEQVLFVLLLKNFGLKINGDAFFSLGSQIPYLAVQKLKQNKLQLESVLFGMAGLLEEDECVDVYYKNMQKEYAYLMHKFVLDNRGVVAPKFFKLRPPNFPTIRLSQFANLYHKQQQLFSKIIAANTYGQLLGVFGISASEYWNTHFTFGKTAKNTVKKLTPKFIDLLIINTVLPIKFHYSKTMGIDSNALLVSIMSTVKKENKSIIDNYDKYGFKSVSAMDSQGLLQLYNSYCTKNKCLQCAVGVNLLKGNT